MSCQVLSYVEASPFWQQQSRDLWATSAFHGFYVTIAVRGVRRRYLIHDAGGASSGLSYRTILCDGSLLRLLPARWRSSE